MSAPLAILARALARTSLRIRVQRALTAASYAAGFSAWALAACALLQRVSARDSAWLVVLSSTLVGGCAFAWRVERARLAALLDAAGALSGRVRAALEFTASTARTAFMEAALRDAALRVREVSPARAVPLHAPRYGWACALGVFALACSLSLQPVRVQPETAAARRPAQSVPSEGTAGLDDATSARDRLASLRERLPALGREHALVEAAALERALRARRSAREADDALLRGTVLALAGPRARLEAEDLARAAEALRDAGDALAHHRLAPATRRALQAALELAREHERQRRERERALAMQNGDAERKLETLQRPPRRSPERKLETLQRPAEPREAENSGAAREADTRSSPPASSPQAPPAERYARALQEGADPSRSRAEAARALQQGADALDELARGRAQRAHEEADERALSQQVAQLREQLQREQLAPQDPGREERARAFEQAARGGGSELDRGPHAPAERRIGAGYEDHLLKGALGRDPARSQVIQGASAAGFASVPYRKVYADYRAHAESVIERDDVPAGERFYVRRYFELVQPRESAR